MRELNIINLDEPTVKLNISDLISIFKTVLIDSLNVDLDILEVTVIAKYSNNRLHMALDTELLREKSMTSYLYLIQDIKRIFGPHIFILGTSIDTNVLINKIFSGYERYKVNTDMSLEIYY